MGEKFKVLQLHSTDQPETHEIIREMRRIADSYDGGDERVLIGEIFLPLPRLMSYYGGESDGVHLPFNFQLVESDWQAEAIARFILDYEAALRSEEHTSELQSLMRNSYAVFCLKKKNTN